MSEKELVIYISASPEMDAECELLGQMLAELTKSVRWVIKRTPAHQASDNPDLETLLRSHFYLILLGMDVMAPVGVEWQAARQAHLATLAYRDATATPSPATTYFVRDSGIRWERYETPQDFVHDLEQQLIRRLIEGTPGYGLSLDDIGELSARLKQLEDEEESGGTEERRGAGQGGIILSAN